MHALAEYKSSEPQRGMCFLPRRALSVSDCEIARAYKVHASSIEPIAFIVPRRVRSTLSPSPETTLISFFSLRLTLSNRTFTHLYPLRNPLSPRPSFLTARLLPLTLSVWLTAPPLRLLPLQAPVFLLRHLLPLRHRFILSLRVLIPPPHPHPVRCRLLPHLTHIQRLNRPPPL